MKSSDAEEQFHLEVSAQQCGGQILLKTKAKKSTAERAPGHCLVVTALLSQLSLILQIRS